MFDDLLSVESHEFEGGSDYNEDEMERLIKMQFVNDGTGWEGLSWDEKFNLFNKFSITILIGNLFTIFGSIFYLLQIYFSAKIMEGFMGFGCFFTWISVIRYFQNTAKFTIITRTFAVAIPKVIAFQFGILPIYIGYTLMGRCLFW